MPTISEALVPPNPKEFDNAKSMVFSLASKGTKSIGKGSTQGFFKFKVGGIILLLTANIENIASTAPAAPNKWPIEDFVELIETECKLFLKSLATAPNSISSPKGVEVPWALM